MSKRQSFLLLGSVLLLAALLFTFSPIRSGTAHASLSPVTFANNNWNCSTAACTGTVGAGQAQPKYQCAEFVARSLAYAGYMPGLGSLSSQNNYANYAPGDGKTYDLLAVTPGISPTGHDLTNYLINSGHATNISRNLSRAVPGDMVVFQDSNHVAQHTAIIVDMASNPTASNTLVDAHNDARHKVSISFYFSDFSNWYILHIS